MLGGSARQLNGLGDCSIDTVMSGGCLLTGSNVVDSVWSWFADNIASMSSEAPPGASFTDITRSSITGSITGGTPNPPALLPPAAPQTQPQMTEGTYTPATAANLAMLQSQQNFSNFMNTQAASVAGSAIPAVNWQWVILGGVAAFLAAKEFRLI